MIVYNISVKIASAIESEWVQWQQREHIPEIIASGYFTEHKFYRLLEQDETDGIVYVVQFFSPSLENYNQYINTIAPLLRQKTFDKWGDQFIAFSTLMQVVN
jgi:hypothetical protein